MRTLHTVALAALCVLAFAGVAAGQATLDARADVHASPSLTVPEAPDAAAPDLEAPDVAAPDLAAPDVDGVALPDVSEPFDVSPLDAAGVDVDADLETTSRAPDDDGPAEPLSHFVEEVAPAVAEAAPPVLATAGFLAVLQALGVWRIVGLGAFAMYSRLTKSELLDNEHRDKVFQLIREQPGIGVTEIAERTGLGWGTTVYHLDRLERAQMVTSERAGLHRCYFPVGTVAREDRKAYGLLKGDTTRMIGEFLVTRPGATQTELCDALGMSPSAASKQLTKLENAGLVRREREWKTVRLFPEGALPTLVQVQGAPATVAAPTMAVTRAVLSA